MQPPYHFPVPECVVWWESWFWRELPVSVWVQAVPWDCPLLVRPGDWSKGLDWGMDQRGLCHLPRGHYLGPSTTGTVPLLPYTAFLGYFSLTAQLNEKATFCHKKSSQWNTTQETLRYLFMHVHFFPCRYIDVLLYNVIQHLHTTTTRGNAGWRFQPSISTSFEPRLPNVTVVGGLHVKSSWTWHYCSKSKHPAQEETLYKNTSPSPTAEKGTIKKQKLSLKGQRSYLPKRNERVKKFWSQPQNKLSSPNLLSYLKWKRTKLRQTQESRKSNFCHLRKELLKVGDQNLKKFASLEPVYLTLLKIS